MPSAAKIEKDAQIAQFLQIFDKAVELVESGKLKIRTNEGLGGMVSFKPREYQFQLFKRIRKLISEGKPARIIILKARQLGMSTAIAALYFALSIVREGNTTLVVAHEQKSADKIFAIYRRMFDYFPEEERPEAKSDSKRKLSFERLESEISVELATKNSAELGRSDMLFCAHFSEFARWMEQRENLQAALSAMPDRVGTIAIIETTANGWGDEFHKMWQQTEEEDGSGWTPFFLPWQRFPEYSMTMPNLKPSHEERVMQREYHLSDRQIAFRRYNIKHKCNGDVRLFDREFPTSPDHAFAATGELVFDGRGLDWIKTKFATDPKGRFDVGMDIRGEKFLIPNVDGFFRLYKDPDPSHSYVIGADPTHNQGAASDDAAAQVVDADSREVVASFSGPVGAHEFGDVLVGMARHYNNALLAIEINTNTVTVERCFNGLGYGNMYMYEVAGTIGSEPTWQMGFSTQTKSRNDIIHLGKRLIRERLVAIYDKPTLMEMLQFKEVQKGDKKKAMAPKGKQDNLVMALLIAFYVTDKRHNWLTGRNYGAAIEYPTITEDMRRAKIAPNERARLIEMDKRNKALASQFGVKNG